MNVYDNYSGEITRYSGVKYEDTEETAKYRPFMNPGADEPVRAGYIFKGYNTKKNGKGKFIYPTGDAGDKYYTFEGLSSKAGATVKLYAIWQKAK